MSNLTKIERERRKAGLTQGELAEKLGVSVSCVSFWENGRTTPTADKVQKMAKILSVPMENLVGYDE